MDEQLMELTGGYFKRLMKDYSSKAKERRKIENLPYVRFDEHFAFSRLRGAGKPITSSTKEFEKCYFKQWENKLMDALTAYLENAEKKKVTCITIEGRAERVYDQIVGVHITDKYLSLLGKEGSSKFLLFGKFFCSEGIEPPEEKPLLQLWQQVTEGTSEKQIIKIEVMEDGSKEKVTLIPEPFNSKHYTLVSNVIMDEFTQTNEGTLWDYPEIQQLLNILNPKKRILMNKKK